MANTYPLSVKIFAYKQKKPIFHLSNIITEFSSYFNYFFEFISEFKDFLSFIQKTDHFLQNHRASFHFRHSTPLLKCPLVNSFSRNTLCATLFLMAFSYCSITASHSAASSSVKKSLTYDMPSATKFINLSAI